MKLPVLDLRPLQEGHASRGIGRYISTLATVLPFSEVVVWDGLPVPEAAVGRDLVRVPGAPRGGRLGWVADARSRRPGHLRVHLPVPDIRLARPHASVVTAFDAIPWRFPADYPAGRVGALRRRGDAAVARSAQLLITCSQASADDLAVFCGVNSERMRVVPLTAGPPWPEPAPNTGRMSSARTRDGRRYVICAGGFQHHDPRKRLEDVVRALARLPEDVALVLTGALGPGAQPILSLADALGVRERVELTGHIPAQELVPLYAGASAFAFPSAWEGFGLPLVEAMSVGLPSVVAAGGALPEVAGDGATVVPVGRPDELALVLEELLGDGARAEAASLRATTRAAFFSVQRFAEEHRRAYDAA